MDKIKILVVDDEARMRKLVKDFLSIKGYQVLEAGDGEEAVDLFFQQKDIALILLDVMMPKMDGWEVVKTIRKYSQVPIIMLTARGEESDELQGFNLGVDEYISKPFSPKILVARVEAILRRSNGGSQDVIDVGGIHIDKTAHQVSVDGKPVDLSYKEFELMTYFAENQGIALSREKILNNVWNYDYFGDARTIDTHVKKLRSKLGEKGEYIKTIWGMAEDKENRDYYCGVIMDEAGKMNRMVRQLLTLTALEFGGERLSVERFDLTELIASVISSSGVLLKQNELTVDFDGKEPVYVMGDEFKIEKVITNYLTNAIHHVGGGEKKIQIRIDHRRDGKEVCVEVFNTGNPIPDEALPNLWTKFYKVDKARTREYGGSGIGLSIVKAIMEMHHKACGVKNHENGVEFWFTLDTAGEK